MEVKVAKFMCATLDTKHMNWVNHTLSEKHWEMLECIDVSMSGNTSMLHNSVLY